MAKRIIQGKTYNTETATRLCVVSQHKGESQFDELYQTRHGAYFRYCGDYGCSTPDGFLEDIEPLTPSEAQLWMEKHASAALLEKHFGEQPEAGESESRITLRIPDTLKVRIEAMADAHNKSLNAWMMRCLENCSAQQTEKPIKPIVRRGYNFSGPDADRNGHIFGLFRLGARPELLGEACGLTQSQLEQIITEGNGGKLPTVAFTGDSGDTMPWAFPKPPL